MLTIRLADPADAADIHRILVAAFEPMRDRYTPELYDATVLDEERARARLDDGPVWMAVVDGESVGTFGIRSDEDGYYLRGMGVLPSARGYGAGRALVDAAIRWIDDQPPARTWLFTRDFLYAAIHLYEEVGFVRMAEDPPPFLGTPVIGMERG